MEPFAVADAVADRTDTDHRAALEWIAATCGAVRAVRGMVAALGGDGSGAERGRRS